MISVCSSVCDWLNAGGKSFSSDLVFFNLYKVILNSKVMTWITLAIFLSLMSSLLLCCTYKKRGLATPGMRIRFGKIKPDPGLYTSNEGRFLKSQSNNILDNVKSLFLVFILFGGRRTIEILDSENQPRSGALGLKWDVWH